MDADPPNLIPPDPPPVPADALVDAPAPVLTDRQIRFVNEYLVDRNGTAAYLRAFGERNTNGSLKSNQVAATEAWRLLNKPEIQAELKAGETRILASRQLTQERIIGALVDIAFLDPAVFVEVDPQTGARVAKPIDEIPLEARRAIANIEIDTLRGGQVTRFKYKLSSRHAAIDKLCKHLGIKAGEDGLGDQLAALVERLSAYKREKGE